MMYKALKSLNLNRSTLTKTHSRLFSAVKIPKNNNFLGLIQHFQRNGYTQAQLDPLGLQKPNQDETFQLDHWQLSEFESIDSFPLDYRVTQQLQEKCHSIQDAHDYLKSLYSSTVGVEFEHIQNEDERLWLYENYEKTMNEEISPSEKIKMLQLLTRTEEMEKFLQKRFATHKRYSSEGSESLIVALNSILAEASITDKQNADNNLEYVVLGMPHRGRLATLVVLNDYPFRNLLYKIKGNNDIPEDIQDRIDDIPTHISVSNKNKFSSGGDLTKHHDITFSMVHNPSHLESQNAVSMGKTKAKQDDFGHWRKVLNIQGHGDAAFTGQGAAYEALSLCKLPKFTINGSIHIITNNQVGFTTDSKDGRSYQFSSDMVKPFGIPIIRVNASDIESVTKACKFMVRYWQTFGKDVIIDMIGYRKYGHNEVDEPAFTQPVMYDKIRSIKSVPEQFAAELIEQGIIKEQNYKKMLNLIETHFDEEFKESVNIKPSIEQTKDPKFKGSRSLTHKWEGMEFSQWGKENKNTGFDKEKLLNIGKASVEYDKKVTPHSRIQRMHIASRLKDIGLNEIDWATAEAMAFGSLLTEGYNVRLAGEDVERGTFSQRHVVLHDTKSYNGSAFSIPLKDSEYMKQNSKGRFQVFNTNLNELGTMGYEYGYSLENPKNLCLWEAQFGDFYNPAQLIVDQYLMCSEAKWLRQSGLVLLLPHGFDGAGPDHSTSHIERFLQNINSQAYDTVKGDYENLISQNINFQVAQCTMPANYFHILRRQMMRNYRKPLVIATPKIGLKHPKAVSKIEDMVIGSSFKSTYYDEFGINQVKKVILCSGKIYFDMQAKFQTDASNMKHKVSVIRVEELAPFPIKQIEEYLKKINNDQTEVYWVQEECMNQGAFQFAKLHIDRALKKLNFKNQQTMYIGRKSQHSFATGAVTDYKHEGEKLWKDFESSILQ